MLGGCNAPLGSAKLSETTTNPFTVSPLPAEAVPATDQSAAAPQTADEALPRVLADLEAIGEIDPAAREKLTSDLQSVKPEHWPLMVQQFKSALAYREQVARQPLAPSPTPPAPQATHIESRPVVVTDEGQTLDAATAQALAAARPLPPPPQPTAPVVQSPAVIPASYVAAPVSQAPWDEDLAAAVTKLEAEINPSPSSIDEVHAHMRLRMLYLLAGRQADALAPIPGVAPEQQDYWSKQLFALESFLDNQSQPDDKLRAGASLIHLDQARAKLAELATLQLRNLNFVTTVDGYGIYQRREDARFKPGDQVTLYTEVENFRSESTKDGYRTTLSTSYEVVDASGKRVDGRQFPDVEDVCQNTRRDLHMRYGMALPTRIYPGEYQLRLTITDQLSHKIGQASLPFEIVE